MPRVVNRFLTAIVTDLRRDEKKLNNLSLSLYKNRNYYFNGVDGILDDDDDDNAVKLIKSHLFHSSSPPLPYFYCIFNKQSYQTQVNQQL